MSSVSFVTHLNKVNVISNNYFNLKIKNQLFLVLNLFIFWFQVIFFNFQTFDPDFVLWALIKKGWARCILLIDSWCVTFATS